MLIAHLITGLNAGGAESQLQGLVLSSDSRRFRHVVISLLGGGPIAAELKAAGVEVHSLAMRRGVPSPVGMFRLARLLRRLRPDVLHCWLYHACLMGLAAGKLAGSPRLIWGLRSANPGLQGYSFLTRVVVRSCAKLSRLPNKVIVNSVTSRIVHQAWGFATGKMQVIPNGTDVRRFIPDPGARSEVRTELGLGRDAFLIGMFARYSAMKDHETFLQAARLVQMSYPAVRFLLAGEGMTADNQPLARLVQGNALAPVVHLLGPRRDLPRLTAALDIACLSSWSESFPNVVVEAMACAVPCVVTAAGDTQLMVGDTGRVVPPSAPQALAEAVLAVIAMPAADRAALGCRARERVLAKFSLEKMVSAYEEIYEPSNNENHACASEAPPRNGDNVTVSSAGKHW